MDLRPLLLAALALASGCVGPGAPPDAAPSPRPPGSMAALGDSITTAANLDVQRLGDNPRHAWATGLWTDDTVASHHERLLPHVEGRAVNLARSGARMADLARQADAAVAHRAAYVTILMGANDACARSVAAMTPVETYRRQFRDAAERLQNGLPEGALVHVASVPDVAALRELFWDVPQARMVWRTFGVCQSLLSERATPADVQAVRDRVEAYNRVLREESRRFGFHHDEGAVHREPVRPAHVSPADFFHPSEEGQRRLAEVTWRAGPFARIPNQQG